MSPRRALRSENVFPAEVEPAIHTHPAIAEGAVVGVADERWGEVGCAVVTVRENAQVDADELMAHLGGPRGAGMAAVIFTVDATTSTRQPAPARRLVTEYGGRGIPLITPERRLTDFADLGIDPSVHEAILKGTTAALSGLR